VVVLRDKPEKNSHMDVDNDPKKDVIQDSDRNTRYQTFVSNLAQVQDIKAMLKVTLDYIEASFGFTNFEFQRIVGNKLRTVGFRGNLRLQPLRYEFDNNGIAEIFTKISVDQLAKIEGGRPLDEHGICVRAFNSQKTQKIDDVRLDPDYLEAPIIRKINIPTLSELAVPIIVDGRSIGVLNLESDLLSGFSDADKILLESVADSVGSTFKRLRYQSQLRELQNINISYAEVSNIESLIHLTITAMYSLFDVSICDFLINIEGRLRSVGVIGPTSPVDSPLGYDSRGIAQAFFSIKPGNGLPSGGQQLNSRGITVRAFNTRSPQLVNDVRLDPDYSDYSKSVVGDNLLKNLSEIAVPIIVNGTSFGVLNIESQALNSFSSQDMELVEAISKLVSTSIRRLNLERENEENIYRSILDSAIDGVGVIEKEVFIFANKGLTEILGFKSKAEILGKRVSSLMDITESRSLNDSPNSIVSRRSYYGERVDGSIFYLDAQSSHIIYRGRDCLLEFYRDVTYQRKMEQDLATQEIKIRTLLERYNVISDNLHIHASRLAKVRDLTTIVEITKNTIRSVFGFRRVGLGLIEDGWIRFISVDNPSISSRIDINGPGITARAVRTGKVQLVNDTLKDPDYLTLRGDRSRSSSELVVPIWMEQKLVGVIDIASENVGAFTEQDVKLVEIFSNHIASALARSYTSQLEEEIRKQNELLKEQNKKLMELDEMKNRFIVTATHELRTPVTAILGFANLMLTEGVDLTEQQKKRLTIINRNSQRLAILTDDLLDLQRIQTGRLSLNVSEFDIVALMDEIIQEVSSLMNEKSQKLEYSIPATPILMMGDRTRISQVLINLLWNAIKFTPNEGKIVLSLIGSGDHLRITVKDSGIGIVKEDIEKLFKPFPGIQHNLNVKSSGLGLSICKGIVDLHNGEIGAISEGLGKGSIFTITIPTKIKQPNIK